MTTTYKGITFPDPETWEETGRTLGSQRIMADGTMSVDYVGTERRLRIRWTNITEAQRDTLRSYSLHTSSGSLILPDAYTYTAWALGDTFQDKPVGGASLVYDAEMEFVVTAVA